jgi:hypothetical protein
MEDQKIDLVAEADVGPAGFVDRVLAAFGHLRTRYGI